MVDKIRTIPKAELGRRIAKLADDDLLRLNRALMIFLGIAGERAALPPSLAVRVDRDVPWWLRPGVGVHRGRIPPP